MRGYRQLKKTDSLDTILTIKKQFTSASLNIKNNGVPKTVFGVASQYAELICRQYLLVQIANLKLNRALLGSIGNPKTKISYPLPPLWRKILTDRNFEVAGIRTSIRWNVYIGTQLGRGLYAIAKNILIGIKFIFIRNRSNSRLHNYVYFDGLSVGNLPQKNENGDSRDIVTWYTQWAGRHTSLECLCHDVKGAQSTKTNGIPVISIPSPIPELNGIRSIIQFTIWGIVATFIAITGLLTGKWWYALILNQATYAANFRYSKRQRIALEYLFPNSSWIYRPLWTYQAEHRGAKISFYFYSTNCELIQTEQTPAPINFGWQAMTWPRYLVWDQYQADFIRRAVGEDSEIQIVGQIWFSDSLKQLPDPDGKSVAVFDVTPTRSSTYQMLGSRYEYFISQTTILFLKDICQVVGSFGYKLMWKQKRNVGSRAHPEYRHFIKSIVGCETFIVVNPDISASKVIEKCEIVISMPFTSTALIAREIGKPSCYYDASGIVQKEDKASHGIDIISGPEELQNWFKLISQRIH